MTTCVSSVNTHTVYWPQWRFLVVLNADLEQFWVQAGVRRVHFLRLSGCPSADPRLFATFWACIVTAGAWSRRGYGVVICGYGVVTARLLTRHNAVTKIYNVRYSYSITLAPLAIAARSARGCARGKCYRRGPTYGTTTRTRTRNHHIPGPPP
jgi:hypothetical protein